MYPLFYLLTVLSVLTTCGKLADALPWANGSLPAKKFHAAHPPHAMDACDNDPYFKVTPENLKESGALEWFAGWDATVNRNTAAWNSSESYYDYILQQFISPSEHVSCNINYCKELPCEDFKEAKAHNRTMARRVYFIMVSVKNIFTVAQALHDQAELMDGIMSMHTAEIAKTFIWQPNPADAKKCKILAGLAKVGIAVAFAAIGAIPGLGPAAEGAAVAGGTAAAAGAAAKTASTAKMVSVSADQANTATLFIGGSTIEDSICSAFPQPSPDHWSNIQAKLQHFISQSIQNLRIILETDFNDIILGKLDTSNGTFGQSILAKKVLTGEYFILSDEIKNLLQVPNDLTEEMKTPFIEKAIATCLRLGQCSIHCVNESVHPNTAKGEITSSRWSPRPGVWCQYQCWRDSTKTKNLELFGMEALQKGTFGGITLEMLGNHAYDDWEANRYHAPNRTNFAVESFTDGSDEQSQVMSGDHLPVCFSSEMAPHDFHSKKNSDKVLPCFCGDMYGNETGAFLKAMHIEEWDGFKSKGLHNACDTSYEKDSTSPPSTFMGYCRIAEAGLAIDAGQQLPVDSRCEEFTNQVKNLPESQTLSVEERGRLMCRTSDLSRNLCRYPGQQDYAAINGKKYHFCKACFRLYHLDPRVEDGAPPLYVL